MRVVIVSPVLPLPFGSTDARWLHVVVTELARRGVEVTCVSSTEESEEAIDRATKSATQRGFELVAVPLLIQEGMLRRKLSSLRRPFSERARSARLRTLLEREVARGYDVMQVEHLFNGWLATWLPRSVVYVHHLEVVDWVGRTDLSLRERQVLFQMTRATRYLLRQLPRAIVATPRIATEISAWRVQPTPVVPIGIDMSLYPMTASNDRPVVGLIGSMHWSPSRRAAERLLDLWPKINDRLTGARLLIGGWNSEKYLGKRFPLLNATLIGEVADPFDFFSQVGVLTYPTPRGTGVKVKVLESFAYGVPVVTNREGFEGLAMQSGEGRIAETDDEFVAETVAVLSDRAERERLRQAARRMVENQHSPVPTVDRLLDAYARLGLI
jgi:glycosyltransferase involved in cell wall biosynthesis